MNLVLAKEWDMADLDIGCTEYLVSRMGEIPPFLIF